MILKTQLKDPDAVLDYPFDWIAWLHDGESITSSDFSADDGITIDSQASTATNTVVWLSGGTAGTTYTVTNRIETDQGRIDDRSIRIRVLER